ncbi:MAG: hypothetical protein WCJ64_18095 [Rhodospirillaceae bacterium]
MTEETEALAGQSLEALRDAIARLVPEAMERAVASYRDFVTLGVPLEAKEFKDHHTAGRTALVHLESLLKLARWAALPAGDNANSASETESGDIESLLLDASRALTALRAGDGEAA